MAETNGADPTVPAGRAEDEAETRRRSGVGAASGPTSVDEARRELHETRRRMSQDMDDIEARLRHVGGDLRRRLDILEPARARIRHDVWRSLAIALGVGLAYGLLTGKRRNRRRGFAGDVVRSSVAKLPGAVFSGVRAGVADRLRDEWEARQATRALHAPAGA